MQLETGQISLGWERGAIVLSLVNLRRTAFELKNNDPNFQSGSRITDVFSLLAVVSYVRGSSLLTDEETICG